MIEIRSIDNSEFRVLEESRQITGYALLFNSESNDLGGFTEIITPDSLNGVLEKSDVLALYNHDDDKVLARNTNGTGTLTLTIDTKGLIYSFDAPKTALGDEVLNAIQRGDLRNSSFAFTVTKEGQRLERRGDKYIRTITQFDKIWDCSPVFRPAYSNTTVAARSLDEIKNDVEFMEVIEEERQEVSVAVIIEVENETDAEELMEDTATEATAEMIDIIYAGNTYQIDKCIIQDQIDDKQLQDYIDSLNLEIEQLKK